MSSGVVHRLQLRHCYIHRTRTDRGRFWEINIPITTYLIWCEHHSQLGRALALRERRIVNVEERLQISKWSESASANDVGGEVRSEICGGICLSRERDGRCLKRRAI